jgi:Skp family chaperone for outer membrane proteins
LRDWLAQAWDMRNKHEPDQAREILDRCLSQAELIRQIIAASQLKADVAAREAKLQRTREEIERKKKALQDATASKKALQQSLGS